MRQDLDYVSVQTYGSKGTVQNKRRTKANLSRTLGK